MRKEENALLRGVRALADGGQATVKGETAKNIVNIAVGSKDHSTLVAALKAADRVDVLANPGPFTVFAPTNAAFDKLPKGTVESLLKPENKEKLQSILEYHVFVGVLNHRNLRDGQTLNQVNGDDAKVGVKGKEIFVNGKKVGAAITASNGVIYVMDDVLLPPDKK